MDLVKRNFTKFHVYELHNEEYGFDAPGLMRCVALIRQQTKGSNKDLIVDFSLAGHMPLVALDVVIALIKIATDNGVNIGLCALAPSLTTFFVKTVKGKEVKLFINIEAAVKTFSRLIRQK
ncbi:hypothetical protein ACFL54_01305 [Planctomycetota bacterium]